MLQVKSVCVILLVYFLTSLYDILILFVDGPERSRSMRRVDCVVIPQRDVFVGLIDIERA